MAIFNICYAFAPFVKLRGWRFLYFFSICDVRNEAIFLILKDSSLRGLNKKNMRKNMKFWPLNPYYKRFDWKTWLSERFSEAPTIKLWNKQEKYMLPKLTEIEPNSILPPKITGRGRGFLFLKFDQRGGSWKNCSEIGVLLKREVLLEKGGFQSALSVFLQKSMFSLLLEYIFFCLVNIHACCNQEIYSFMCFTFY